MDPHLHFLTLSSDQFVSTLSPFAILSHAEAQLELFGSSANGFGSVNSDVDLCLILNQPYQVCCYVTVPIIIIMLCKVGLGLNSEAGWKYS